MTHTLHRRGSAESLLDDFLVQIVTSKQAEVSKTSQTHSLGLSIKKAAGRLVSGFFNRFPGMKVRIERILFKLPPAPRFLKEFENKIIRFVMAPLRVFNKKSEFAAFLRQLKDIDLGSSVVVSGLFDEVNSCLKKIGIQPHTVQFSLESFGRIDRLPEQKILEVTTMCGHHLISSRLVERFVKDVKALRMTPERAAKILGKQCICGAFNEIRATRLIKACVLHDDVEAL